MSVSRLSGVVGLVVIALSVLAASPAASVRAHSNAHRAAAASGPGFVPARGWRVLETGLSVPPEAPSASASNVRFVAADRSQESPPTATVSALRGDGVVLWAQFYPSGEYAAIDRTFPVRRLPLRLAEARTTVNPEGFDGKGAVRRIEGRMNGYNADVVIFFGSRTPSARAVADAREELARLTVPGCPTTAEPLSRGDLRGATRSLMSWLRANYVARPSDLRGARATAGVVAGSSSTRIRAVETTCKAEASRLVAVKVTPSAQGRANIGRLPLLYFLSKTVNGWSVWREG